MQVSLRLGFVVFMVMALCMSKTPVTESLFNKFSVQIVNDFKNHTLEAHCKSKDNDLELQHISVRGEFKFKFRINFTSTILFYCNMWWVGGQKSFSVFKVDDKFLLDFCTLTYCRWKAQEDGIYVYSDKHKQFRFMYHWDH
ncbi:hypothetical protein Pint_01607 [Pistacia integerrima]|uniref:Uncharacterized protein n=1 Tax=Pistacia integerrima TaxID=434235 RepID=A0ACC0ZL34_9ROSI|nr:hypothetical protein Pint_01607 [Pistacia integerrima]